jgi:hypothetical protein
MESTIPFQQLRSRATTTFPMNCVHCGSKNPENQVLCLHCGRDPVVHEEWPADLYEWIPPALPPEPVTSRLALASLGLGLLAIFPLAGIPAILLGHAALIRIARSEGLQRGRDVARLGLICGYAGLIVFCSLFFGTAWYSKVPLRSVLVGSLSAAANKPAESSGFATTVPDHELQAIRSLVQLHMAEQLYSRKNLRSSYTCEVEKLRDTGFPAQALRSLTESGYVVTLQQCVQNEAGRVTSYNALAISRVGIDGRNFCTDETGVIRVPSPEAGLLNCTKTGAPLQ